MVCTPSWVNWCFPSCKFYPNMPSGEWADLQLGTQCFTVFWKKLNIWEWHDAMKYLKLKKHKLTWDGTLVCFLCIWQNCPHEILIFFSISLHSVFLVFTTQNKKSMDFFTFILQICIYKADQNQLKKPSVIRVPKQ